MHRTRKSPFPQIETSKGSFLMTILKTKIFGERPIVPKRSFQLEKLFFSKSKSIMKVRKVPLDQMTVFFGRKRRT